MALSSATARAGPISIKSVSKLDVGRIARLHHECFEDPWSRSDIAHLLAIDGGYGLIARLSDGPLASLDSLRGAGFAIYRVVRDESELLSIGVSPFYRRQRIASALIRESMMRVFRNGVRSMFLEVAFDNASAIELYQAHGFEQVGTRKDYYVRPDGDRANAYTMRCDLVAACCYKPTPLNEKTPDQ